MDVYIFNELSITPFTNRHEAKEGLKTFIQTCVKVRELGFKTLHLHENIGNLYDLQIAPDYKVSQWLQDSEIDKTLQDQFRSILTKSPLINDYYPIAKEKNELSEFKIKLDDEVKLAEGLGYACLLETLCVSFLSHDLWNSDEINNIEHWYLKDDGSEVTKTIAAKHGSRQTHLAKHKTWLENQKRETLQNTTDLWEKRKEFFPHLIFCPDVKKQLKKLRMNYKYLDEIIEKLKLLDQYSQDWKEGPYRLQRLKEYGLDVSPESPPTRQQYAKDRTFRLPNRERKVFEHHIKAGDLRFHFYPDNKDRKIYVGYIGKHLPTVTDPH